MHGSCWPKMAPLERSISNAIKANCFTYWDDCVDPEDLEAMWMEPEVRTEWLDAGETKGQKVHLSRDPDGQSFLTQTEMKAVADITVRRHFDSRVDPEMLCAISELESNRQLLATRYNKKCKDTSIGILQVPLKTAAWLARDFGYQAYDVDNNPDLLHRPFINAYFGAAYLRWLSNYDGRERSEEFIVRAYKCGTKKATHKSTLPYWRRYLCVKESLPSRKLVEDGPMASKGGASTGPISPGSKSEYWDSRTSPEDMENMWQNEAVNKEWTKSGQKGGRIRFSLDKNKRPYVTTVELKAIAEIILSKYFSTKGITATVLCAIAEIISSRLVNGVDKHVGLMGIDYSRAFWLYTELGNRAYRVDTADDLIKPFVSMYFGTAYFVWLSEYEGRERSLQFVVQAYISGPQNVNNEEPSPLWLKFEQTLSNYEDMKRDSGSCIIL